jgi:hypothetical protein
MRFLQSQNNPLVGLRDEMILYIIAHKTGVKIAITLTTG